MSHTHPDGLYADKLDDGIRNAARAQRHLAAMSAERRAMLEAKWMAGEDAVASIREPISDAIKARAEKEWSQS